MEAAEKAAAEAAAAKELQLKRDQQRERDQRRPATYQGYIAALKDGYVIMFVNMLLNFDHGLRF